MILEMLRFWYPVECPTDGNKLDCGILALRTVEEQVLGQILSKFKSHVLETHPKGAKTIIGKRDQQLQSGKRIRLTSKTTVMHWKTARPFWCRHDMQHHRTLTNQDWIQTFGLVQDQLFWQRSEQVLTFLIGRPRWQRFWFGVMTG